MVASSQLPLELLTRRAQYMEECPEQAARRIRRNRCHLQEPRAFAEWECVVCFSANWLNYIRCRCCGLERHDLSIVIAGLQGHPPEVSAAAVQMGTASPTAAPTASPAPRTGYEQAKAIADQAIAVGYSDEEAEALKPPPREDMRKIGAQLDSAMAALRRASKRRDRAEEAAKEAKKECEDAAAAMQRARDSLEAVRIRHQQHFLSTTAALQCIGIGGALQQLLGVIDQWAQGQGGTPETILQAAAAAQRALDAATIVRAEAAAATTAQQAKPKGADEASAAEVEVEATAEEGPNAQTEATGAEFPGEWADIMNKRRKVKGK